jgi:trk system potassium uptake protein TrkH
LAGCLGLHSRLVTQVETPTFALGDMRGVLLRVAVITLAVEAVTAGLLTIRFWAAYDYPLGQATWHGVFHSVMAFNNAGFALYGDSLIGFVTDPWICVPVMVAVLVGGLGFPVMYELGREFRRPAGWSVHTKITLMGSAVLLAVGTVAFLAWEWFNPATAGPLDVPGKVLTAVFHGAMPRSAGFNALDYGAMRPETLVVTDILMFIGGGSASTAGGIKITTFFLLAFVIWAEVRGEPDVTAFGRRISSAVQRQALAVALLGVAVVVIGTLTLLGLTQYPLDKAAFEAVSAFTTTGLSTGITSALPGPAQLVLVVLMFIGRVGTITVASALALTSRDRRYRYPEERPIVG